MLVLMEDGAGDGALAAVRARIAEAGLGSALFGGGGGSVVAVEGETEPDLGAALAALPGVARVLAPETDEPPRTSNLRVARIRPLVPPEVMMEELPLSPSAAETVQRTRREVARVLRGEDDRLLVVVGPCSVHDGVAALDYARRLAGLAGELAADLRIVMRVYFEKPRTTVGWKGLINDPYLDESFAVNDGLRLARRVLLDVVELGLPAGCEFLDPISPQFLTDAVTWGAIGARTTESQVHRNLASGLSMPIGFKNATSGDVQVAIDAMQAAAFPHQFLSVTEQGLAAIVVTRGNRDTHVILRGGSGGPNYDAAHVEAALATLAEAGLPARLMIDTSHGNSAKDYRRQPVVAAAIAEQIAAGQRGIIGVLMESFLVDGQQRLTDRTHLVYGQSITDGCMGWDTTVPVLRDLAASVRARRARANAG